MFVLQGAKERVERLYFSPRDNALFAPCDGGVQVWQDVTARRPAAVLAVVSTSSIHFLPNSGRMIFDGRRVSIHGGAGEEAALQFPLENWAEVGVSPDGRFLVAAQYVYGHGTDEKGRLVCRSLDDPAVDVWSVPGVYRFPSRPLFLPAGDRFLAKEWWNGETGRDHGPAWMTRDLRTGQVVAEYREQGDGYSGDLIQSADRSLFAGLHASRITVYRTEDPRAPLATIKNDSRKEFTGAAFHPSGRFLAATSNDNTVKFYDVATWGRSHAFDWDVGRLRSIAFSADGGLAAAGGDRGQIVVWDVDI
jgi:WD40 repeat protein